MSDETIYLTAPVYSEDCGLLFPVYRYGWGYVALRLPAGLIREKFGIGAQVAAQLLAAFGSNRDQIMLAISRRKLPNSGQRLQLDGSDF